MGNLRLDFSNMVRKVRNCLEVVFPSGSNTRSVRGVSPEQKKLIEPISAYLFIKMEQIKQLRNRILPFVSDAQNAGQIKLILDIYYKDIKIIYHTLNLISTSTEEDPFCNRLSIKKQIDDILHDGFEWLVDIHACLDDIEGSLSDEVKIKIMEKIRELKE